MAIIHEGRLEGGMRLIKVTLHTSTENILFCINIGFPCVMNSHLQRMLTCISKIKRILTKASVSSKPKKISYKFLPIMASL